jgi:endonuclease/exonuclease/phosphatase family metal-dependent hydrolase
MKLVSYNIQYGKGKDGCFDLARICAALEGADLIALQEVERHWPRSREQDQPAEIARLLGGGYHAAYGPGFDVDASGGTPGTWCCRVGPSCQRATTCCPRWASRGSSACNAR